jgi:hypothetical protein
MYEKILSHMMVKIKIPLDTADVNSLLKNYCTHVFVFSTERASSAVCIGGLNVKNCNRNTEFQKVILIDL